MPFHDLREYISCLDANGKLHRISKEVDREWEIAAVTRRVFQRFHESQRPALLFENIKGYEIPLLAGALGASMDIYSLAVEAPQQDVLEKWRRAQKNPIDPIRVETGPCKEIIIHGDDVDLMKFPIPIWTAGHDAGPYITAPLSFSVDPETGVRNIGTYRTQVKGPRRAGMNIGEVHDLAHHIKKNEAKGRPTPVAIVIGTDPALGLVSVTSLPEDLDELAVAGGLRGKPVEVVKCETCDLEVPATAEIVVEAEFVPNVREPEGPFGEYPGYLSPQRPKYVLEVKCITHRREPIYQAFLSQMPPSESTIIRGVGHEVPAYRVLKDVYKLPIKDLHYTIGGSGAAWLAISMKKRHGAQVKQAVWAAWAVHPPLGKFTVVVDDDIDVRDPIQLQWAMSFRCQPDRDIMIVPGAQGLPLDPSVEDNPGRQGLGIGSKIAIDATKKKPFPPLALPPQEHLEKVDARWEEYGFRV